MKLFSFFLLLWCVVLATAKGPALEPDTNRILCNYINRLSNLIKIYTNRGGPDLSNTLKKSRAQVVTAVQNVKKQGDLVSSMNRMGKSVRILEQERNAGLAEHLSKVASGHTRWVANALINLVKDDIPIKVRNDAKKAVSQGIALRNKGNYKGSVYKFVKAVRIVLDKSGLFVDRMLEPPRCEDNNGGAKKTLVAEYDWKDGAKDVSGNGRDGELQPGAVAKKGTLEATECLGMLVKDLPLDGVKHLNISIENVDFSSFPCCCEIAGFRSVCSTSSKLAGDSNGGWSVGYNNFANSGPACQDANLYFQVGEDRLEINPGGGGAFPVCGSVLRSFQKVQFVFDGTLPAGQRLSITSFDDVNEDGRSWIGTSSLTSLQARGDTFVVDTCREDGTKLTEGTIGKASFFTK